MNIKAEEGIVEFLNKKYTPVGGGLNHVRCVLLLFLHAAVVPCCHGSHTFPNVFLSGRTSSWP